MNLKLFTGAAVLSLALTACLEPTGSNSIANKKTLTTDKDKYSYALGASFGKQVESQLIARDSIDLDLSVFLQAFTEYFGKQENKYQMTDSLIFATLNDLSQNVQKQRAVKDSIAAEAAFKVQKEFLDKNKTNEGIVETESGLQYKILKEGKGEKPSDSSIVSVHYKGTLLDGTVFDSSYDRGEPLNFPLTRVIPGWQEMLKLMNVGSKVQAWIPSKIGYGSANLGKIPSNSLLVFEMELLEIKAPEQPKKAAK